MAQLFSLGHIRAIMKNIQFTSRKTDLKILAIAVAILLPIGWIAGYSRPMKTKFYNSTGQTLSNVVISCAGRTNRFAVVSPGSELHLVFRPRSSSDLTLSFDSATRTNDFYSLFDGGMDENTADGDWLSVNIRTDGVFANFIGKGHMFDEPY